MHTLLAIIAILIILAIFVLLAVKEYHRQRVLGYVGLLQAAAWDLVRQMENNPRSQPKRTDVRHAAAYKELVLPSGENVKEIPSVYVGELRPATVLSGALEVLQKSEKFRDEFWFKVQGIRNGLQIFLMIVSLRNIEGAYILMIEHMKRQRDELEKKNRASSPNLPHLKLLLGLPTEWPVGDLPERSQKIKLGKLKTQDIKVAVKRYKMKIFEGLIYKTWPDTEGQERLEYHGERMLEAMREYIR